MIKHTLFKYKILWVRGYSSYPIFLSFKKSINYIL
nr:MAG TPA: hypothetical protein [Caudoviricetes sp.]